MDQHAGLAEHFDQARGHLRAVAYRMLGSADEADDAVQEAWLRACRLDMSDVVNPAGWLTTITGRVCLDMLRARRRRREEVTDLAGLDLAAARGGAAAPGGLTSRDAGGPEDEAVLADSVGLALLVVLDRLGPAERIAFVLHDLFAVPFDEIARVVDRSPVAAKKLASRARQRVYGADVTPARDVARQREVVEAFLAASRAGDLAGLLAVLDPDAVRRTDRVLPGIPAELRGARKIAEETAGNVGRARSGRLALVNGAPGIVVAPAGRLLLVVQVRVDGDRITAIDVTTAPASLRRLRLAVPDPAGRG